MDGSEVSIKNEFIVYYESKIFEVQLSSVDCVWFADDYFLCLKETQLVYNI